MHVAYACAQGKGFHVLATIEDTREALYKTLKALGPGWHDRQEIAAHVGKNRLNPVDTAALDLLVSDGRVEKVSQQAGRGNVTRWVYRVVKE
jgi:hypothetical protein